MKQVYHIGHEFPIDERKLPTEANMKNLASFSEENDLLYISDGNVFYNNFLKTNADILELLFKKKDYSVYKVNISKVKKNIRWFH